MACPWAWAATPQAADAGAEPRCSSTGAADRRPPTGLTRIDVENDRSSVPESTLGPPAPEPQGPHGRVQRYGRCCRPSSLVQLSFGANVILFAIKVYILIVSGSLSVFASTLDSSIDLLAQGILMWSNRLVARPRAAFRKVLAGGNVWARAELCGSCVLP